MALIFIEMCMGSRHVASEGYWRTTPDAPQTRGERSRANLDAWCARWNEVAKAHDWPDHFIVVDDAEPVPDYYTPSLF